MLASGGEAALARLLHRLQPLSLIALLATLVLLFGFQGRQILAQPLIIAMLAVPILIQVYFNSGLAYLLNRAAGEAHCIAAPSALIGASNFFELAVAAAISLFGFDSGAALATVVGVLDRGAGDAVGREDRECDKELVRCRGRSSPTRHADQGSGMMIYLMLVETGGVDPLLCVANLKACAGLERV